MFNWITKKIRQYFGFSQSQIYGTLLLLLLTTLMLILPPLLRYGEFI